MKKFLILLFCFSLTSCFEITERIKHHLDQSGQYSLVVDFSKSWFKTKSAMLLEEIDGVKIPDEADITQKLAEFKSTASKIEGISNVKTTTDFSDYIFTITLDYKNLSALNTVLNSIDKQKEKVHFLSDSKTKFERRTAYLVPEKLANDPKKKADLQAANSIAIYTFDTTVQSVSNSKSKLSKNKKTVFLKQSVYDVLQNPTVMNNTINLLH